MCAIRELLVVTVAAFVVTWVMLIGVPLMHAQVMQSSNYRIQSDSINIGGGYSTSTTFVLESTGGEIATGESSSATYNLHAGYQQMQEVFISLTGATAVSMDPSIPGVTGGTSNGSTTVTVTTDSPSGYSLTIRATSSPAMQKDGDTIADYAPSGDPDFSFTTGATDSHFGYTPEGVDIVQLFQDDGGTCNTGALDTAFSCWEGLSTGDITVASSGSPNHPNGATTSIKFRVGIGGSVVQPPGTYTATTTLTALAL